MVPAIAGRASACTGPTWGPAGSATSCSETLAVLRSIQLDDVADDELRRNVADLKGVCGEQLGLHGEAHASFAQILSEVRYFTDVRERARRSVAGPSR